MVYNLTMNKIQTIVNFTKIEEDLSYRGFASALKRYIKQGSLSHQAVADWVEGKYVPRLGTILQIIRYSPEHSWEHRFSVLVEDVLLEMQRQK